ncbi:MAG: GIY-YIG nuclease family protein [Candidatus Symbiothrix sp.]|jgi:putative endonuclease|nr:GIY-YIG nuclease family protein [Candidatus Symbiothrix sp.]
MEKGGCIYIMTNKNKTVLYIGVTNDLRRRVFEHRTHYNKNSFTAKYNLEFCIYYEYFMDIRSAIDRETELKKWSRAKKDALINSKNPLWENLV